MLRAIDRRLSSLEELIPLPLTYARFAKRVNEHARRSGVSPGAALASVIDDLSEPQLARLFEELGGTLEDFDEIADKESLRRKAIKAGYSPEDVELLVRHFGQSG